MKLNLNRKYTTIAAYSLLVIAFGLILGLICFNLETLIRITGVILDKIACLFFSLFFTFCFLPLVRFFEKLLSKTLFRKKAKAVVVSLISTLLVDLLFLGIVALVVINIIPAFMDAYESFNVSVAPTIDKITQGVNETGSPLWISLYNGIYNIFSGLLSTDNGVLINAITVTVSNIISKTYDIAMGLVLSTYFLVCRRYLGAVSNKFFTAILPENFRNATFAVVKRIYNFFVEFFSYRLLMGFALALISYILLRVFGVPYAIIVALVVFVMDFIPVFGPILATIGCTGIVAIFSLASNRLWQALLVLIILASLHLLTAIFVEPFLLRKKLRPGPGVSITCIVIFYALFGFSGIIFAVPLYTSFDVAYREIVARLLAKKNLPLNNAYYLTANELPVTTKESAQESAETVQESPDSTETEQYVLLTEEAPSDGEYNG